MSDITKKRAGLLLGSFTADALSLGVHWIYDTDELKSKFGYIDHYHAPGPDSYHPTKSAGEQSHIGDQALKLTESLSDDLKWDPFAFIQAWVHMWRSPKPKASWRKIP